MGEPSQRMPGPLIERGKHPAKRLLGKRVDSVIVAYERMIVPVHKIVPNHWNEGEKHYRGQ
jgi:hypothetical protein